MILLFALFDIVHPCWNIEDCATCCGHCCGSLCGCTTTTLFHIIAIPFCLPSAIACCILESSCYRCDESCLDFSMCANAYLASSSCISRNSYLKCRNCVEDSIIASGDATEKVCICFNSSITRQRKRFRNAIYGQTRPPSKTPSQAPTVFNLNNVLPLDCVICLDAINDATDCFRKNCGHIFHLGCISQWESKSV